MMQQHDISSFNADYNKRIDDLFSRHPSVQKSGFSNGAYKEGLEGMRSLDSALGSPWKKFRIIHVAGTNGKGSVSSMIASALSACGLKTALYTSPHILDFRERMRIISPDAGPIMISREDVIRFLDSYDADIQNLSFFEITTGMAFWWFAEQNVDIAVIEVGLGGRLDSTNIIESPELSIVTSIGLDHCAMLGSSRAAIAGEKAGIFKKGSTALVWGRDSETSDVFSETARATACKLIFASECSGLFNREENAILDRMDLKGMYQAENLHTVSIALSLIPETSGQAKKAKDAICKTAARTGLRGRWERLNSDPEVICDIGHNPPALRKNFAQLSSMNRPLYMVYGIMVDKDLDGISHLMPQAECWHLCAPATERSLPAKRLMERMKDLRPDLNCACHDSVAEAVRCAISDASHKENSIVYIGGSTFVVAEAIESACSATKATATESASATE